MPSSPRSTCAASSSASDSAGDSSAPSRKPSARSRRRDFITWVIAGNKAARAFYESLGGELIVEQPFQWDGMDLVEAAYGWRDLDRARRRLRRRRVGNGNLRDLEKRNDHQSRHQRLRPHRPQHPARALRGRQEARSRDRRGQRPRQPGDQRAPDALRHGARQVSGQGRGRRRRDGRQRRPDQGARAAQSGGAAVGRARRRRRARMHGALHDQGEGRPRISRAARRR